MSYVEKYFKEKDLLEERCKSFFNEYQSTDEIEESARKLTKLEKQLIEEKVKHSALLAKRYNESFTPVNGKNVILYNGKINDATFDVLSGFKLDDEYEGATTTYSVNRKNGDINIIMGYAYNLGAVVINAYHYIINSDNTKIKLTMTEQKLIPIIQNNNSYTYENGETYNNKITLSESRYYTSPIKNILSPVNATQFLNEFYGLERENYNNLNLYEVFYYSQTNPMFETIVKTAPVSIIKRMVADVSSYRDKKPCAIHVALGLTKEELNTVIEKDLLNHYLDLKDYLKRQYSEETLAKHNLNKTPSQWIDYLDKCKAWDEDLAFYGIDRRNLVNTLLDAYVGYGYTYTCKDISKYYKFGKFCNYVIEGTINQGYSSIANFARELHDYINMCIDLGVKPTLESSYLHQTHDITARNHKIAINEQQEEIFKKKYADFTPFKREKYSIIAPETTIDIRKEGDMQNNCVASYIKRVIDGKCLIYFMRETNKLDESLVTIEVKDDSIVQAKQSYNNRINEEQKKFLADFAKKRGLTLSNYL